MAFDATGVMIYGGSAVVLFFVSAMLMNIKQRLLAGIAFLGGIALIGFYVYTSIALGGAV